MTNIQRILRLVAAASVVLLINDCAGKSLRPGESAPLTDGTGKIYGTRQQLPDNIERHRIDLDQNGTFEKQYDLKGDGLVASEHYFPDGKIRVRTFYQNGKPNRSEVYNPDGSLRGVTFYNNRGEIDTVDLPARNRRVEFLAPK